MKIASDINEYIQSLITSGRLGHLVAHHMIADGRDVVFSSPAVPWSCEMKHVIQSAGIQQLYSHQAAAIDRVREGHHVVVATPTASGKTLVYNLPVLERVLAAPESRALYIFPLKALAQDQLRTFNSIAVHCRSFCPSAAIYDGDTSAWHRRRIREKPPNVLLTNPEMIHLSLLPHHGKWAEFFSGLSMVVVDEVHTYRGVMGSHMAQVFRRLLRVCEFYGARPTFVFCSATVANPDELVNQLTGLTAESIISSGAPQGRRHVVFINPVEGPSQAAILLLKAALHRRLRTIVYTQSRKMAELIALWASNQAEKYANRISAYRAGFLPEERREIESRLASGDLLAVISTSALELGIDIGDLDLCLLVGYPGSIVSTWQRSGRVGRSGQDSALVLIAGDDALDQYFMRHPGELIDRAPESAVINPFNSEILERHLVCAAAEHPLGKHESLLQASAVRECIDRLEKSGELLKSGCGQRYYARRTAPHRHVDLRGIGSRFQILSDDSGQTMGEIDGHRAFKETHPRAIYLHKGKTFIIRKLDLDTRTAEASSVVVDYFTRYRGTKTTEILETYRTKDAWGTTVGVGKLRVTEQVTGFEKWKIRPRKRLNVLPLDLPPLVFETEGLWVAIPSGIQQRTELKKLHFMGGIHAAEHAIIGILPLVVMADRNDFGGISTPFHSQVERAAVFVYDAVPGGAGLSRQAFGQIENVLGKTLDVIRTCGCNNGCPACVHSPKCGSGNRPIDKAGARYILSEMKSVQLKSTAVSMAAETKIQPDRPALPAVAWISANGTEKEIPENKGMRIGFELNRRKAGVDGCQKTVKRIGRKQAKLLRHRVQRRRLGYTGSSGQAKLSKPAIHYGVFDLETQRSAAEVGGWHRADRMGISCAVLYDSVSNRFHDFSANQVEQLTDHLQRLDLVVGFNIRRFDYQVLRGYVNFDFRAFPTLDILEEIHSHLGFRLSLDHLAGETLGTTKTADGLQALEWWKQGRIREIVEYCRKDVAITRELFLFGKQNGYLLFRNKAGNSVRVPVNW